MRIYMYGMRARGVSPACQPKDMWDWMDGDNDYFNFIFYKRALTEAEEKEYELDFIQTLGEDE